MRLRRVRCPLAPASMLCFPWARSSGKNLPSGVTATYSGVPVLAGIKYYVRFMPQGPVRVYGHFELGMMFGSVSGSGHTITITESKTDFTLVPSVGVEIPAGPKGAVDLSARYFDISKKSLPVGRDPSVC